MLATSTAFLIGPGRFLCGINLLEVAMDRKPNIGLAHDCARYLHVVNLDLERRRHRVAQVFIECPIRTDELPERRTLIFGTLAVDEPGRA